MSVRVKCLDERKAKVELKKCPKIVRDYFSAMERSMDSWKRISEDAIAKLKQANRQSWEANRNGKPELLMPTDKQLIDIAILFNDGKLDKEKLACMVGMCQFVLDRLQENNDVSKASSKEK